MNPLNDAARRDARSWSGRLGSLAAELPAPRPEATISQLGTVSPTFPTHLSSILEHFRRRHQRQQDTAEKHRAQEFLMGM
jgi:hypothetical protein